jgi:hypothetical protein
MWINGQIQKINSFIYASAVVYAHPVHCWIFMVFDFNAFQKKSKIASLD